MRYPKLGSIFISFVCLTLSACATSQSNKERNRNQNTQRQSAEGQTDKSKHHNRHHGFDNPANYAERWNSPDRDAWQKPKEVADLLELGSGMTVADLGTGTGYFLRYLSSEVWPDGKVLALDVSKNMLEYVNTKITPDLPHDNIETQLVKRDDPGLAPASVDRILTVNTWHHVKNRVAYAQKLHKALKPGGMFIDVDYTRASDKGPPDKIKLPPEKVVRELEKAGFQAQIVDESLPEQYVVRAVKTP